MRTKKIGSRRICRRWRNGKQRAHKETKINEKKNVKDKEKWGKGARGGEGKESREGKKEE